MLPEFEIPPLTCVVHGVESHGFMTGATGCKVRYASVSNPKQVNFELTTSNPWAGINSGNSFHNGLKVNMILGGGNNNVVHFTIYK
jgi:hypothetical protein